MSPAVTILDETDATATVAAVLRKHGRPKKDEAEEEKGSHANLNRGANKA
jgi:hypothetical protein